MADIAASNWSETDASNTSAAPDGAPEGMAPSGVNNVLRAHQGAEKRFWNKINAVKTTAGTTSAYTLSYDVAPGAYYDGEILSFVVNATNAAAATLNVNSLGAIPLRLFGGNLLAGALLANQIVQARYSTSAGAFDIIPQNGWVRLGEQDPSAASTVDFASIPAGVKHIRANIELAFSTAGTSFALRTYGADGVLDSGASDYLYTAFAALSNSTSTIAAATASSLAINDSIGIGTTSGYVATVEAGNIQASTYTKFLSQAGYLNNGGNQVALQGTGYRSENDRITGVRFLPGAGTITGKITLFASA
jgi:hypothetical protein